MCSTCKGRSCASGAQCHGSVAQLPACSAGMLPMAACAPHCVSSAAPLLAPPAPRYYATCACRPACAASHTAAAGTCCCLQDSPRLSRLANAQTAGGVSATAVCWPCLSQPWLQSPSGAPPAHSASQLAAPSLLRPVSCTCCCCLGRTCPPALDAQIPAWAPFPGRPMSRTKHTTPHPLSTAAPSPPHHHPKHPPLPCAVHTCTRQSSRLLRRPYSPTSFSSASRRSFSKGRLGFLKVLPSVLMVMVRQQRETRGQCCGAERA